MKQLDALCRPAEMRGPWMSNGCPPDVVNGAHDLWHWCDVAAYGHRKSLGKHNAIIRRLAVVCSRLSQSAIEKCGIIGKRVEGQQMFAYACAAARGSAVLAPTLWRAAMPNAMRTGTQQKGRFE